MTHLTREELVQWRDHPQSADRGPVLAHLASCHSCSAMYAELIRTAPVTDAPVHFDPADFVERGYAIRRDAAAPSMFETLMSWKVWTTALGTAAIVTLLVTVGPWSGPRPGDTTRGSAITLSPSTGADPSSAIQWTSGVDATTFQVFLKDATGDVVFATVTTENQLTLPTEVVTTLLPGAYTWTVTARGADGQAITSGSLDFSIAAPR